LTIRKDDDKATINMYKNYTQFMKGPAAKLW